ncbi:MAG: nucleotidyltransferase family protein [Oscillospiraceae bacterium]
MNNRDYFLHLLASVLHGRAPLAPPLATDWTAIYRCADAHQLHMFLCEAVSLLPTADRPPEAILKALSRRSKRELLRDTVQAASEDELTRALEQQGIRHVPFKGRRLKKLYPKPELRMMADLDVLIDARDAKKVRALMLELGYQSEEFGRNHDVYFRQPFMNVEMHRRLVAARSPFSSALKNYYADAKPQAGSAFRCAFSDEALFVYLLIHMHKHFISGGTGIRMFLDIWLFHRALDEQFDTAAVNKTLEKIGLSEFRDMALRQGDAWFGADSLRGVFSDDKEIRDFVFGSGTYGTEHHGTAAKLLENRGGMLRRTLEFCFPPLDRMAVQYPVLGKLPVLLPLCWVARGARDVFRFPQRSLRNFRRTTALTPEQIDTVRRVYKKSGLIR